jgi:hypothetical protein
LKPLTAVKSPRLCTSFPISGSGTHGVGRIIQVRSQTICEGPEAEGAISLVADDSGDEALKNLMFDYRLGKRILYAEANGRPIFTDNETNTQLLYGAPNRHPYCKDAFHRAIVNREEGVVNPNHTGTKSCLHYEYTVPAGGSVVVRLRLVDEPIRLVSERTKAPLKDVDQIVAQRRAEADEFYAVVQPPRATEDEKRVQRQALAGLLWTKQIYLFDVNAWLQGDNPKSPPRRRGMVSGTGTGGT